ncbi:CobW family GTP-binding protein [Ferviditalea candida]|uniref:GTP-binding protein n=1 Tax=Ferviditalea candida TaxID=3108399 RepID=A0ABU5ZHI3_9BACL|nr:GTP-binding protein [Paenibacillaceae bacterium T2]
MGEASNQKIPVIIVSGFLGSGKTTLLSKVLEDEKMKRTAVLVNEYGKVGLDHHLLERLDEKTLLLEGGCVCCSTREDLVAGLSSLLNRIQRNELGTIDRVVIETTGLADPAPILFTILTHPMLQHHFYIHLVIVTVDALNGIRQLESQPESIKQVTSAEKIILTKTDMVEAEQTTAVKKRLMRLNPSAEILEVINGETDSEALFLSAEKNAGSGASRPKRSVGAEDAGHEQGMLVTRSVSILFDDALDWNAFGLWLSMLLYARGEDLLRVKGLLDVGEAGPVVLNGVQHIIHPPEHLNEWPDGIRRSRLIFIMKSIDPLLVIDSLEAFQHFLGAKPSGMELEVII